MISKELHLLRKRNREVKQKKNKLAVLLIRILYKGLDEIHKDLSKEYRNNFSSTDYLSTTLTYGEVSSESFLQILNVVNPTQESSSKTFVDLGSGSGKAVMIAALSSHLFKKVAGIEIVPSLHGSSIGVYLTLQQAIRIVSTTQMTSPETTITNSTNSFIDSNFLNEIIVFINRFPLQKSVGIDIESLARHLCEIFGHKKYKSSLKSFRSLKKFLLRHTNEFLVLNETVKMNPDYQPLTCLEQENIDEMIHHPDTSYETHDSPTVDRLSELSNVLRSFPSGLELLVDIPEVVLQQGDIFINTWWIEEADIVYVASLLFTDEMMLRLALAVENMRPKSWFITLKPLPTMHSTSISSSSSSSNDESKMRLQHDGFFKMSWQMAKVYFYQHI